MSTLPETAAGHQPMRYCDSDTEYGKKHTSEPASRGVGLIVTEIAPPTVIVEVTGTLVVDTAMASAAERWVFGPELAHQKGTG